METKTTKLNVYAAEFVPILIEPTSEEFPPCHPFSKIYLYQWLRHEADSHQEQRRACLMEAHIHQKITEVNDSCKQQAHAHLVQMEDCNKKAAQILLEIRQPSIQEGVLDLHDFRLDEGLWALQCVLAQKEKELSTEEVSCKLSIITGRGCHSRHGVAKIRPAVINYIRQANYRFQEETEGMLEVWVEQRRRHPAGDLS